jgi:hypothetical protein
MPNEIALEKGMPQTWDFAPHIPLGDQNTLRHLAVHQTNFPRQRIALHKKHNFPVFMRLTDARWHTKREMSG